MAGPVEREHGPAGPLPAGADAATPPAGAPVVFDPLAALQNAEPLSRSLTAEYLEHHAVIPLGHENGKLVVATWVQDVDERALDDLRLIAGRPIALVVLSEPEIRAAIRRVYSPDALTAEDVIAGLAEDRGPTGDFDAALDDLVSLANEAPVVKLVNLLLLEALEARASDVHLEQYAGGLRVRYRIDGVLQDAPAPPRRLSAAVVSRLKIMAELDIAERRVAQDGRIRLRMRDRQIDVRVSTLPTLHGESVVLRLLDKERGRIGLEDLGMAADTMAAFARAIARPHGIVLSTGPTGSGKTTTLYAAVDRIRTGREKIITVEDPVEYELPGVPQVPVNEKVGLTFATALRALLRQDPDIMLVGEIRDQETADIATHAALTGHLVLSTLHTNDAATALTRLVDLGIEPYLVASTVEAVLAQRLVRRICAECTRPVALTSEQVTVLGLTRTDAPSAWAGRGCNTCRGTGYRGRTGIYELLVMDDELRTSLQQNVSAGHLTRLGVSRGMRLLREDGLRQIRDGVTTAEEVLRVANA
ncbi:MAG: Flp pilus assembly complex ATPase component TadA [Gemmatimonadetes bacterium]|nr:Flp pilus assembly complex ATPase component TadA [Gemmatimonadota bacterium]